MRTKGRFKKNLGTILVIMMVIQVFSGCLDQKPPSTVTGHVTAEDGSYIPDVKVTFLGKETFTDEEGYFSFDVPPGAGNLSLSKEGFVEIAIVVEVADESIDTKTVVLPEEFGDIVRIGESTEEEYTPSPEAENLIQYYSGMGFDQIGTVRVEYTTGIMNITTLITSTKSAFVIESEGAGSIMFDFTEKVKEIRVEEFVFTASFDALPGEYVVTLQEEFEWGSAEDLEDFQRIFAEKNEEEPEPSEASEFIKSLMEIDEDSVHPDLLYIVHEPTEKIHTKNVFLAFGGAEKEVVLISPQQDVTSASQHDRKGLTRNFEPLYLIQQHWGFINTVVHGLHGVMYPPPKWGIVAWWQRQLKKFAALDKKRELVFERRKLEAEKRKLEAEKDTAENDKMWSENYIEEIEEKKKELEELKKKLEEQKKELEEKEGKISGCNGYRLRLKEEIKWFEEQIGIIEEGIKDYEKYIKETEEEIKECEKKIKENEDKIKKIEKRLKEIEESIKPLDLIMEDC